MCFSEAIDFASLQTHRLTSTPQLPYRTHHCWPNMFRREEYIRLRPKIYGIEVGEVEKSRYGSIPSGFPFEAHISKSSAFFVFVITMSSSCLFRSTEQADISSSLEREPFFCRSFENHRRSGLRSCSNKILRMLHALCADGSGKTITRNYQVPFLFSTWSL